MQLELYTTKKKYKTGRELLRSIKIVNLYQSNTLNNTILRYQASTKTAPSVFLSKLDFLMLVPLS